METKNNFITVTSDKHNQTTTTESKANTPIGFSFGLETGLTGISMQLKLRHVKSTNHDSLLLDLRMDSTESWLFLRYGSMSLILDGENIKLECNESYSDTEPFYSSGGVREVVYYKLNKDILDKICSAKEIELRISGDKSYVDIKDEKSLSQLQIMCKHFYNGFYDNTKYSDSLQVEVLKKGGCFIATAAMGDYNHPVVIDLRSFRDNWLLKRNWGVRFTNWYYIYGPKAANIIRRSYTLRKIIFYLVILPLQSITKKLR